VTAAYAAVANGGLRVAPSGVLAIVDGRGTVRARFMETSRARAIPARCVEPTRRILREVVRGGTGQGAGLRAWPVFGKTGTTTGNADAWFVGWSEGRVMGVWMGRRRDAEGAALAGRGAPADLFRRVAGSANAMTDARLERARPAPQVARAKPAKPAEARRPAEARTRPAPVPLMPREFWPDEGDEELWVW
jgi:penicillin-binding protein 1A